MAASVEGDDRQYPDSYYCALTLKVMSDPVIDPEGHTYERAAISEWLSKNQTSPMTRAVLRISDLVPNRALKCAIEAAVGAGAVTGSSLSAPTFSAPSASSASSIPSGPLELQTCGEGDEVLVSVVPPAQGQRAPVDICCVIDVSGSMCVNASLQNEAGSREEFDIDLLDVVKHSVRTVVSMLEASDRLCLVAFSSSARLCLALTAMNPAGRKRAEAALNEMSPDGSTNLWAGLHLGLETLRGSRDPPGAAKRLKTLILLTDGLPNVEPPRGHVPALQKYLSQHPELLCSVNTFGFGYSLDSQLLSDMAVLGSGSYSFIPDSGFVGTIFVNFLANTLSTVSSQLLLAVKPLRGARLSVPLLGGLPLKDGPEGSHLISLGSCQFFQSRDCLLSFSLPADFDRSLPVASLTLEYHTPSGSGPLALSTDLFLTSSASPALTPQLGLHRSRLSMADTVKQVLAFNKVTRANDQCTVDTSRLPEARELLARFVEELRARAGAPEASPLLAGFLEDMAVQVTQACSREDWYRRWGQHYLPSFVCAHLAQQCNNFKDPGVQGYGKGKLFTLLQEEADDVFLKIPPPSRKIASMEVFNNRGGGCFAGDCLLLLADSTLLPVHMARRGDQVFTSRSRTATIRCVVRTRYPAPNATMCLLPGGLKITAWHPVSLDGGWSWTFPAPLVPEAPLPCPEVYSFVLDHGHTVSINGVQCVTLGHSFTSDVRAHPYFGSPRVLDDLSLIPGWDQGFVDLTPDCFVKSDSSSSIIERIVAPN